MYFDYISILTTLLILVLAGIGFSRSWILSLHNQFLCALIGKSIKSTNKAYSGHTSAKCAQEAILNAFSESGSSYAASNISDIIAQTRSTMMQKSLHYRKVTKEHLKYIHQKEHIVYLEQWEQNLYKALDEFNKKYNITLSSFMFKECAKQLL